MGSKGIIFIMFAVCLLGTFSVQEDTWAAGEGITVMTRNLYLGADITPVITAQGPEEFFAAVSEVLAKVALTNFPERADGLAAEIAEKMPQLVGLQEALNFTFNGSNTAPPFRDYLADLLAALTARGADYRVAGVVRNLALELPFGGNVIGVIDRDVILARSDVPTETIDFGSLCRTSQDGCNYQVIATVPNPLGSEFPPIGIERGFVAVEAEWPPGNWTTFVNTHLEGREVGPYRLLQAAQAQELVAFLAQMPAPVIVVGDFNSDLRDPVLEGPIVSPYQQLAMAGYFDAWLQNRPGNPNGLTCCQDEDLFNLVAALYERIDLVFSSEKPRKAKVDLVGNQVPDKTTPFGLWPSDHAGVAAQLEFEP
jgi:endonuclease/exonuclease/phosphatase family metal-dependent hydrolase